MPRPYHSSPAERLAPGSVRNPRGANDAVLRSGIGHTTGNIRLTPSAATIAGSAAYNFGKVDDRAIGTYRLEWQGAASPTAEPLGAINRVEFTLYENTAGVYLVKINTTQQIEKDDTDDSDYALHGHQVADSAAALVVAQDITDAEINLSVMTSGLISDYSAADGQEVDVAVGDLLLMDASDTGTRVFSLTRLS